MKKEEIVQSVKLSDIKNGGLTGLMTILLIQPFQVIKTSMIVIYNKQRRLKMLDVIKQIKCLDGSQWDINENRCISCDKYGLVWDAEFRSCKIMLKDTIKKIKTDDENDFIKIGLKVIVDNKDKILGYLE